MSLSFGSWLSGLPLGAPVVCFGSRVAPSSALSWCRWAGASVALSGRLVVSGGAAGCDSAFAAGSVAASVLSGGSGGVLVFRPVRGSGVAGLFDRSRAALRFAAARGGAAVVCLPAGARRGGSLFSLRFARSLGLPVFVVRFVPFDREKFLFQSKVNKKIVRNEVAIAKENEQRRQEVRDSWFDSIGDHRSRWAIDRTEDRRFEEEHFLWQARNQKYIRDGSLKFRKKEKRHARPADDNSASDR